jgi:serine/threonine-protein kinase
VKPGNVMINRTARSRSTDFGIARAIAEAQMTLPGTTLGSVHYFSPSRRAGDQTTRVVGHLLARIVLFELLTGHRPWEADSAAAVAMARLAGPRRIRRRSAPASRPTSSRSIARPSRRSRPIAGRRRRRWRRARGVSSPGRRSPGVVRATDGAAGRSQGAAAVGAAGAAAAGAWLGGRADDGDGQAEPGVAWAL